MCARISFENSEKAVFERLNPNKYELELNVY